MLSPAKATPRGDLLNVELGHLDWSRWFAPSIGRVLAVILLMQGLLFLSDRYDDWRLFSKGHAVLIAVAATAFFLLVLVGCLLASHVTQSRSQFSLATLLFMVPVMAVPCAWLGRETDIAKRQGAIVESLRLRKMASLYSYDQGGFVLAGTNDTPVAAWLHAHLGREFFSDVSYVDMRDAADVDLEALAPFTKLDLLVLDRSAVTDTGLAHLAGHKQLRGLSLIDAQVTDKGLQHLKKLPRLKWIFLAGAPVTDDGVKELRAALPECRVVRSRRWPRHW